MTLIESAANIRRIERPESVSAQTYEGIRHMIISCQLSPGTPVIEADLARQFGISRSPLREAVRRLEEEGFVEVIEGRARLVATITPGKVLQLYELRCVLEKFAADRAQGLISSEALDRVTGKFDDLLVELDRANVIPFNNCDFEFHSLYISRRGNPLIIQQLRKLESQLQRVWNYVGSRVFHTRLAYHEHLEIVDAIRLPRPGSLAAAVERHIIGSGRRMAGFVEERAATTDMARVAETAP
jgi:GntR family transcriptional regulator, rspAB operon transcriptional repressor